MDDIRGVGVHESSGRRTGVGLLANYEEGLMICDYSPAGSYLYQHPSHRPGLGTSSNPNPVRTGSLISTAPGSQPLHHLHHRPVHLSHHLTDPLLHPITTNFRPPSVHSTTHPNPNPNLPTAVAAAATTTTTTTPTATTIATTTSAHSSSIPTTSVESNFSFDFNPLPHSFPTQPHLAPPLPLSDFSISNSFLHSLGLGPHPSVNPGHHRSSRAGSGSQPSMAALTPAPASATGISPGSATATPSKPVKPPAQCSYCGMTFKKLEHCQRHERTHTLARPYSCVVCLKTFARQDTLNRHLRLHNRSEDGTSSRPKKRLHKPSSSTSSEPSDLQALTTHCARPNPLQTIHQPQSLPPSASPYFRSQSRNRVARERGLSLSAIDEQSAYNTPPYFPMTYKPTQQRQSISLPAHWNQYSQIPNPPQLFPTSSLGAGLPPPLPTPPDTLLDSSPDPHPPSLRLSHSPPTPLESSFLADLSSYSLTDGPGSQALGFPKQPGLNSPATAELALLSSMYAPEIQVPGHTTDYSNAFELLGVTQQVPLPDFVTPMSAPATCTGWDHQLGTGPSFMPTLPDHEAPLLLNPWQTGPVPPPPPQTQWKHPQEWIHALHYDPSTASESSSHLSFPRFSQSSQTSSTTRSRSVSQPHPPLDPWSETGLGWRHPSGT